MIIKTITCHDVYNLGASLQAYALMTYLQQLGHDVEIIDYKPEYLSKHYKLNIVGNPKYEKPYIIKLIYLLLKLPGRLMEKYGKRKREFDQFKEKYLNVTERRYGSNEELKNQLPVADLYIAGSDQIWNTLFPNGKDPAFYLDFAPKDKLKISYAASFATEHVVKDYLKFVSEKLQYLDCISVRELSGIDILKELEIAKGNVVLDPVFLLHKRDWENLIGKSERDWKEKYILIYDFDHSPYIEKLAKKLSKENHWKIYSIQKNQYADKVFWNCGPIEFLKLINHAEFVISNSFHATAFSLIFQKLFCVVNREEGINTRMRDLLKIVSMEDRIVSEGHDELGEIDYDKVIGQLDKKIEESKQYLNNAIKMVIENEKDKNTFCN